VFIKEALNFMETLFLADLLTSQELAPLTRPEATLSPSDGERDGVRGRWETGRFIGRFIGPVS